MLHQLNSKKEPYLSVFTTNYDMLFEDLFRKFEKNVSRNFTLVNGFQKCTATQKFDDNNIPDCGNVCKWNVEEFTNNLFQGLHLLRMHGCVSWFQKDKKNNDKKNLEIRCNRSQASLLPQR